MERGGGEETSCVAGFDNRTSEEPTPLQKNPRAPRSTPPASNLHQKSLMVSAEDMEGGG